jgi:PleD family two-component response regulator
MTAGWTPLSDANGTQELICRMVTINELPMRILIRASRCARKILLADDSNTALMMERTLLATVRTTWWWRATARGVKQALDENPDLIILDVVMPCMDGFDACRELRRLERHA